MRSYSEVNSYLRGGDGLRRLTDYNFRFVAQTAHYVQRIPAWLAFLSIIPPWRTGVVENMPFFSALRPWAALMALGGNHFSACLLGWAYNPSTLREGSGRCTIAMNR